MNAGAWLKCVVPLIGASWLVYVLLVPAPAGLPPAGWHTLGVAVLMASLWVSEAIPFAVTAMLPLVFFPML